VKQGDENLFSIRPNTDDSNQPIAGATLYDLLEAIPANWKLTAAGCYYSGSNVFNWHSGPHCQSPGGTNVNGGVQDIGNQVRPANYLRVHQ
jgi:hypothetical protein